MDRNIRFAGIFLLTAALAACGGGPEPETGPDPDAEAAAEEARRDSIARADSIRMAREREAAATELCERAAAAMDAGNYENARSLYRQAQTEYEGTECAERADGELDRLDALAVVEERIHFEYDRAAITDEAAQVLQRKAEVLRNDSGFSLTVEGHCDERGSNEYNMALGQRRAEAVAEYLVDLGVSEDAFRTVSYGEERPLEDASDEEAWAANRRAEFVVEEMGDL